MGNKSSTQRAKVETAEAAKTEGEVAKQNEAAAASGGETTAVGGEAPQGDTAQGSEQASQADAAGAGNGLADIGALDTPAAPLTPAGEAALANDGAAGQLVDPAFTANTAPVNLADVNKPLSDVPTEAQVFGVRKIGASENVQTVPFAAIIIERSTADGTLLVDLNQGGERLGAANSDEVGEIIATHVENLLSRAEPLVQAHSLTAGE